MGIFDKVKKCWNKLTGGVTAPSTAEVEKAALVATEREARAKEDTSLAGKIAKATEGFGPATTPSISGHEVPALLPNGFGYAHLCEDGSVLCNGKVYDGEGLPHDVVAEPPKAERTTNASRRAAQTVQDRQRQATGLKPVQPGLNRAQRRALASIQGRK